MENILLVCTVGGSKEPIAASIKYWMPQRIVFVVSPETKLSVMEEGGIVSICNNEGLNISPVAYDIVDVEDAQNFMMNIRNMKSLTIRVEEWLAKGDEYKVVVDFTGGTKCMTAALALAGRRWKCQFSYVGGDERTKDGVGVVVQGKERILNTANPWDVLGYQAVEDAVEWFNRGAFHAADKILEKAITETDNTKTRRELSTLKALSSACHYWELFRHGDARNHLYEVKKNSNDFLAIFGDLGFRNINNWIDKSIGLLTDIVSAQENIRGIPFVKDLLANARRRAEEGRFDDAVARLYRATEAFAQAQFSTKYNINTKEFPTSKISESCRRKIGLSENTGTFKIGLQGAYAVLDDWGDDVGKRFSSMRWNEVSTSPLMLRNDSILAHGYKPMGNNDFKALWKGCLLLTGIKSEDLMKFVKLPRPI